MQMLHYDIDCYHIDSKLNTRHIIISSADIDFIRFYIYQKTDFFQRTRLSQLMVKEMGFYIHINSNSNLSTVPQ